MSPLVVSLILAAPVVLGYALGLRLSHFRLSGAVSRYLFAASCGLMVAYLTMLDRWTWPIGLISPLLYGVVTSLVVARLLRKISQTGFLKPALDAPLPKQLDGLVGAAAGLLLTIGVCQWALVASRPQPDGPIADSNTASAEGAPRTALGEFARLAHQGFVQHVPIAGEMTDEILAVAKILDHPLETRKEFAVSKRWDALATLPSFTAIVEDEQLLAQLDSAAEGNLLALYRLQKHPLVLEFAREEQLEELIEEFDAQTIADELASFATKARAEQLRK